MDLGLNTYRGEIISVERSQIRGGGIMDGPVENSCTDYKRKIIALKADLMTRCGLGLPFIMYDDECEEYYKVSKNGQRIYVSEQDIFHDESAFCITDGDIVKRANLSVEIALMEMRELGVPVVFYEPKTGKIYKEYSDGTRNEVNRDDNIFKE